MKRARWYLIGAALLLLAWGARVLRAPAPDAGQLASGALAPLDTTLVTPWEEVARLPVPNAGGRRIAAIDIVDDSLYVLFANTWSLVVDGAVVAGPGSIALGDPVGISAGVGIVRHPAGVAILETARPRLITQDLLGQVRDTVAIGTVDGASMAYKNLVARDSTLYVSALRTTVDSTAWILLRVEDDRVDTVFARSTGGARGSAFAVPRLAPRADGGVVVVNADSWTIESFGPTGARESEHQRRGAARYAVPAEMSERMQGYLRLLGPAQQTAFALGATLPPVHAITQTSAGDLLVLTSTTGEATIAELVRVDGTAIATLWAREEPRPVFAVRGVLLRVRIHENVTIIERQRLRGDAR